MNSAHSSVVNNYFLSLGHKPYLEAFGKGDAGSYNVIVGGVAVFSENRSLFFTFSGFDWVRKRILQCWPGGTAPFDAVR